MPDYTLAPRQSHTVAPLTPFDEQTVNEARGFSKASKAENTRRAYQSDWQQWQNWCEENGRAPLPADPETVAAYITILARTHKVSTISRRLTVIAKEHKRIGQFPTQHDEVRAIWEGIRRSKGVKPTRKEPATIERMRLLVDKLPSGLIGTRDRALLLLGFAGALRRSEIVALNLTDVSFVREGMILTIRKSKTDQYGEGQEVSIPYGSNPDTCPVRSLQDWIRAAPIAHGALFRSVDKSEHVSPKRLTAQVVALLVKDYAEAAGLDPKQFSGHSLRAGLVTTAFDKGVERHWIQQQTRHKNGNMLDVYNRNPDRWKHNAAAKLGL